MSTFHLVKVRFDRRTDKITQGWLNNRYKFFAENTLRSLQRQVYDPATGGCTLWINCDPGMESPSMAEELLPLLPSGTVLSFGDGTLTFSDFQRLNPLDECNRLWGRLERSTHTYVTRIDSDDLFSQDALRLVQECKPIISDRVEASLFRRGYLHDVRTKQTGVYYNPSSPFHTIMFPTSQFLSPQHYAEVFSNVGDHSRVAASLPCQGLPDWKFTVLIHGNNFVSDMYYGAEPATWIERDWNVERWMSQPVVFDLDDFCDLWGDETLAHLDQLKATYPNFRCTLFTIPKKSSVALEKQASSRLWIELAAHGIDHNPNEELKVVLGSTLGCYLKGWGGRFVKGFRPPAWYIEAQHIEACNRAGYWVALHKRDEKTLGPLCKHGYYCCDNRLPYHHGHVHNVCGNWLRKDMTRLLTQWPKDQAFSFVSEAVLLPQQRA